MPYVPAKGHTLFIPGTNGPHLFVIITGLCPTLTHLLVNFSSVKPGIPHDTACLVNVGEHPFITVPTYVEYQFARIEMASDLTNRVDGGVFTQSDPVSAALLLRIQARLHVSHPCPRKFKNYLTRHSHLP